MGRGVEDFIATSGSELCQTTFDTKKVTLEIFTPPKINMEPENDGLEDVSPFPEVYSQVPC